MEIKTVRQPAVAGMFYPRESETLDRELTRLLASARETKIPGQIIALVSPHAGYQYSGLTAAHGFKLVQERKYDTVVIVSPSHREYFDGISVFDGAGYQTPLGVLEVDAELRDALTAGDAIIESSSRGHHQEHAIEVQLPFIQKVVGAKKILPIVIGDQRRKYCFHLGEKLAGILKNKNVLLVASSDLSHYYPYDVANSLDKVIVDDVAEFNYEKLMDDLESDHAEACGGGPMVAVLIASHRLGANRAKILHHCNSGDVTGDRGGVVGYLSAVAFRTN